MAGNRLGCLDSISIRLVPTPCGQGQGGGTLVGIDDGIQSVELNRILDDVSSCKIIIGNAGSECCRELGQKVFPWCASLIVYRNDELIWGPGPVTNIVFGYETTEIEARDAAAFLTARVARGALDNSKATTSVASGSNSVNIDTFVAPGGTLFVADASRFNTDGGVVTLNTSNSPVGGDVITLRTLRYTGVSGNTLTGVTSGGATGYIFTGTVVTGPSKGDEITDLAEDIIESYAAVGDNGCLLANLLKTDLGDRPTLMANTTVNFQPFEGTLLDYLDQLSELGLDWTVIGNRLLLGAEGIVAPIIGTLTDEHIGSEIRVSRDGLSVVNRMFVRYEGDDDTAQCAANCKAGNNGVDCVGCSGIDVVPGCFTVPCPAIAESDDIDSICYGPIERLSDEALGFDLATAQQLADKYIRYGSGSPLTLDFGSGARLTPNTPFGFNDIIPGGRIRVALQDLCVDVQQEFQILELNYIVDAIDGESVTLSLGPFNEIGKSV